MIEIKAGSSLVGLLKKAVETGTVPQLVEQLDQLDNFHGSRDDTIVFLTDDIPPSGSSLNWHAVKNQGGCLGESLGNGGLVYHEASNTWSLNT